MAGHRFWLSFPRQALDGPSADALDETANDPHRRQRMEGHCSPTCKPAYSRYAADRARSALPLDAVAMPIWQAAC